MYSQKAIELNKNPENLGQMRDSDGEETVEDSQSGTTYTVYLKVEFGVITKINFWVSAASVEMAGCSMATILAKGKHLSDALKITEQDVIDALECSPESDQQKSINLILSTLRKAIDNYLMRRGIYHIQFQKLEASNS
ncbi:iron-sulfur cluster assembly scaffold protein [Desulfosporosinus sp. PR]|uniref:iron-sulfur cluster assembly scaffold protein n=1 Tax=Candidatus Desulfosporosinus nitrosoreducens TaxID=3401928 RepID=UPI0027FB92A0|nr:iron-sulfur cluster assembly scaffold protein [Desulfosporosinus sp. PR]MDQ7095875.1 iron-sulfur cluster assembly scaffold protein [Desulfosporosinus sp. PR]